MTAVGGAAIGEAVAEVVRGRRVILTSYATSVLASEVDRLLDRGADDVFVLGLGEGTGETPGRGHWYTLDTPHAPDLFSMLHGQDRLLTEIPGSAIEALDRFDPAGEAVVLAGSWTTLQAIAGRRVLGPRPPEWAALEDKAVLDRLLVEAGLSAGPGAVVAADPTELLGAAALLDEGAGTVWAGDASQGVNGNGDLVRWVRHGSATDAGSAAVLMSERCARVRVTPFLEGVPCSIHAFVFPTTTCVFRPVELLVLRRQDGTFLNAGTATMWDPPAVDREAMRATARLVGEHLRSAHDYRGAFGVDGVLTADGFRITEVNPRLSGGFSTLNASLATVSFRLLDVALREHLALPTPDEFEDDALRAIDGHRVARGYTAWAGGAFSSTTEHGAVEDESGWRLARKDERPLARLTTGPSPGGGVVAAQLEPEHHRIGEMLAPTIAALFQIADEQLGSAIGPVTAAAPV